MKLDTFTRAHLKTWLKKQLAPDANLESFVILIEEWLGKQQAPNHATYWLNRGWPAVWEQFVKDGGLEK
jgi:hypothetical protein